MTAFLTDEIHFIKDSQRFRKALRAHRELKEIEGGRSGVTFEIIHEENFVTREDFPRSGEAKKSVKKSPCFFFFVFLFSFYIEHITEARTRTNSLLRK